MKSIFWTAILLLSTPFHPGPAHANPMGRIDYSEFQGEIGRVPGITGSAVEAHGSIAYVVNPYAFQGAAFSVIDMSDRNRPVEISSLNFVDLAPKALSARADGLVSLSGGSRIVFVDASDPHAPIVRGSLDLGVAEVWDLALDGSCLLAACGGDGLWAVDVSDPSHAIVLGSCAVPGGATHVAFEGGIAIVGGWECHAFDVRDPQALELIERVYWVKAVVNDVAIEGTRCLVAARNEAVLFDVDPENPAPPEYVHSFQLQTWADDVNGVALSKSGSFVFTREPDGSAERIYSVIEDGEPEFRLIGQSENVKAISAAGDVVVEISAFDDFRVLDAVGEAYAPHVRIDSPEADRISARGALVVWTTMDSLHTAIATGGLPVRLGGVALPEFAGANDLTIDGGVAALATFHGTMFVDVANPAAPEFGSIVSGRAENVRGRDGIFFSSYGDTLRAIDATDPGAALEIGRIVLPGSIGDIEVNAGTLAASGSGRVWLLDVSEPSFMEVESEVLLGDCTWFASDVRILGDRIYLAGSCGSFIVELQGSEPPHVIAELGVPLSQELAVSGGFIYLMTRTDEVVIIDAANPSRPAGVGTASFSTQGGCYDMAIGDGFVSIAAWNGGVYFMPLQQGRFQPQFAQSAPDESASIDAFETRSASSRRIAASAPLRVSGPNPFRGRVRVAFGVPEPTFARVDVYDVSGRLVAPLRAETFGRGEHMFVWDGHGSEGAAAPGVYFVRFQASDRHETVRVIRR